MIDLPQETLAFTIIESSLLFEKCFLVSSQTFSEAIKVSYVGCFTAHNGIS